jgi:hypothetical protein
MQYWLYRIIQLDVFMYKQASGRSRQIAQRGAELA